MGADQRSLVSDATLAGSDAQGTAYALAEALKSLEFDLVVFGAGPRMARPAACRPPWPSDWICPCSRSLSKVEVGDSTLMVHRETEQGYIAYECPAAGRSSRWSRASTSPAIHR